jgi:IS5 family transposase
LINLGHPLVKLADEISRDKMELEFQNLYSEQGRPSIPIRKIAGLLLLKEMFKESDESVVERWIEVSIPLTPYFKCKFGNLNLLIQYLRYESTRTDVFFG